LYATPTNSSILAALSLLCQTLDIMPLASKHAVVQCKCIATKTKPTTTQIELKIKTTQENKLYCKFAFPKKKMIT
jgi:hypothetical protein